MEYPKNHFAFCLIRLISLLCLSSLLVLGGCATRQQSDGPPPFDVDVSKIPDAVPKKEPRSKYGNMASYRVYGKKYVVLQDSRNYHERGIASWYGMKFHKQKTSSGEPYNLLAMTAAHKNLPLPTYVQVTNLKNNKKIIVKVNDRGPFAENRIIDLSYAAAKKLGMIGHGTTYVDVKAIQPGEPIRNDIPSKIEDTIAIDTPRLAAASKTAVYLQVGAFKNKSYADNLKNRLDNVIAGSPVKVSHPTQTAQLYRVKIGPIHDVATADTVTKKLRALGLTPTHIQG